jgi:hypothetical protein
VALCEVTPSYRGLTAGKMQKPVVREVSLATTIRDSKLSPTALETSRASLSFFHSDCPGELGMSHISIVKKQRQLACKPGSVHTREFPHARWMIIHLEGPLPDPSRNQPGW